MTRAVDVHADAEVADAFVRHFAARGVSSQPDVGVVFGEDASTLFVTAGIQVMRRALERRRELASVQWCLRMRRADRVGIDRGVLTSFRMATVLLARPGDRITALERMMSCWERVAGLTPERLAFVVSDGHEEQPPDDRSHDALIRLGVPESRILRDHHRFAAPFGPQGPTGPNLRVLAIDGVDDDARLRNPVQFWNLEFLDRMALADGSFVDAPHGVVDSAGSIERLAAARIGTADAFSTGTLKAIDDALRDRLALALPEEARRVVVDHVRSVLLLLSAGVVPGAKRHGHVLRRLLRIVLTVRALGTSAFELRELLACAADAVSGDGSPWLAPDRTRIEELASEQINFDHMLTRGWTEWRRRRAVAPLGIDERSIHELHASFGVPKSILGAWLRAEDGSVCTEKLEDLDARHREHSRHWVGSAHPVAVTVPPRRHRIMTESTSPGTALGEFARQMAVAIDQLHLTRIARVAGLLSRTICEGRTIWTAGNGGSAALADHLACDLVKCVAAETGRRIAASSLCGNSALLTAIANDLSFDEVFSWQLAQQLRPGDAVVLVSSSGNSPNVVRACRTAEALGARTFAIVGFDGGELARIARLAIRVDVQDYGVVESAHLTVIHMIARAVAMSLGRRPLDTPSDAVEVQSCAS